MCFLFLFCLALKKKNKKTGAKVIPHATAFFLSCWFIFAFFAALTKTLAASTHRRLTLLASSVKATPLYHIAHLRLLEALLFVL